MLENDALVVLGAEMVILDGKCTFPLLIGEGQNLRVVGGNLRALAAVELYNNCVADKILVTGGRQEQDGVDYSRATELTKLINSLGVPERVTCALTHEESSTFGNIRAVESYLKEHPQVLKHQHVAVLTSKFHLRAEPFFKANGFCSTLDVRFFYAEDVLGDVSDEYKLLLSELYTCEVMRKTLARERKGLQDFNSGNYRSRG